MVEDKSPELLKLRNGKVRGLHGSESFVPVKTYAHVSFINHRDIVVAITDRHRQKTPIVLLDHAHDISFLFGRNSAADHRFTRLAYAYEVLA